MTAAALLAVGTAAELTGDIRTALAWQLPVALLGLALACDASRQDEQEDPKLVVRAVE